MTPPKIISAKLIKKEFLNDESMHFTFELQDPCVWTPGQFALIEIPDSEQPPLKRPFSIASSPHKSPLISFFIKHHHGRATNWLFSKIKEGDTTNIMLPMGHMTLQENQKEHLIIGTGIGIAPMFSLIEDLENKKFPSMTRLIYGARYVKEIFYFEKLQEMAVKNNNFEFYPIVSRPETEWNGQEGRVDSIIQKLNINFQNQNVYICGSPPVAKSVKELILNLDTEEQHIHMESF
jgi:ferredoxin-NADP reductase